MYNSKFESLAIVHSGTPMIPAGVPTSDLGYLRVCHLYPLLSSCKSACIEVELARWNIYHISTRVKISMTQMYNQQTTGKNKISSIDIVICACWREEFILHSSMKMKIARFYIYIEPS